MTPHPPLDVFQWSSPLTTHHSLLTTHHPLLTTHYSPPTTHHSPLTTHYSLLITHNSSFTAHQMAHSGDWEENYLMRRHEDVSRKTDGCQDNPRNKKKYNWNSTQVFVRKLDLTKSISWNCENLEGNKLFVLLFRVVRAGVLQEIKENEAKI